MKMLLLNAKIGPNHKYGVEEQATGYPHSTLYDVVFTLVITIYHAVTMKSVLNIKGGPIKVLQ